MNSIMTQKTKIIGIIYLLFLTIILNAQTQKGQTIYGKARLDNFGFKGNMQDENTLGVSAPYNNSNGTDAGQVTIYSWNGGTWVQKGADINGEATNDYSGFDISLPDANTVAIGAPYNDNPNGKDAGHARVFQWNGANWVQKGGDIDGEAANDYAGRAVSMPDANTVAVGAYNNSGNGNQSGHVRIFTWNGSSWIQKGADINGETSKDQSGKSVSMPDVNTVAIGAPSNDGNGSLSGHVRVYNWNGTAWVQKGADIDGEAAGDQSGTAISMPDPNTIAIGAVNNDGNGTHSGQVRIFTWNGSNWIQKGTDLDGQAADDESGSTVSMSNANTVAIGAVYNSNGGPEAGHARVFGWDGSKWKNMDYSINGLSSRDFSGTSVSLTDNNTLAIGAVNDNGNNTGYVRVFKLSGQLKTANPIHPQGIIYPNPTDGTFYLSLEQTYENIALSITDVTGREIATYRFENQNKLSLSPDLLPGIYFIRVNMDKGNSFIQKIVVY